MRTQPSAGRVGAGIITDPMTPWHGPAFGAEALDTLSELVTSTEPLQRRLSALQDRTGLSGASPASEQWEALAAVATIDLAVARMLEPHIDALRILHEAGAAPPGAESTWGVFAAEAPGATLRAVPAADGEVVLEGTKAWCSLASELSHAIVTARIGQQRQAFAVSLTHPGVHPSAEAWPSLGLSEIPSGAVTFDSVPAVPVGPPGWYLERPGFAWGGIRVAACWFGGALGLARGAADRHADRPHHSPLGAMTLGQLDGEITAARAVLAHAARAVDADDDLPGDEAWALALRVRNVVYRCAQRIQILSRELAGPAALTGDRSFAKADADLTVYLSQHHGPRDEAALGDTLVAGR